MQCCPGHMAWAPEGREGQSQAGPKDFLLTKSPNRSTRSALNP